MISVLSRGKSYLTLIPAIIITLTVFLLGLVDSQKIPQGIINAKEIVLLIVAPIAVLFSILLLKSNTQILNFFDCLIICFHFYSILSGFLFNVSDSFLNSRQLIIACLLIIYWYPRIYIFKWHFYSLFIIYAFYITGLFQIATAYKQHLSSSAGYHFPSITGFFANPGPFAIYISIFFCVAYCCLLFQLNHKKIRKSLLLVNIVYLFSIIPLLFFLESRSSIIGLLISIFFISILFLSVYKYSFFSRLIRLRLLIILFAIPFIYLIGQNLYTFKKDSADGRIFIWKTTYSFAKEHFILGVGLDNFAVNYMKAQHDFFIDPKNAASVFRKNSGDVAFAFNDFIQIFAELGFLGLFLYFLIICIVLQYGCKVFSKNILKEPASILLLASLGGVIIIVISGISSYPYFVLPTRVMFWFLLGIIVGHIQATTTPVYSLPLNIFPKKHYLTFFQLLISMYILQFGLRRWAGLKEITAISQKKIYNSQHSYNSLAVYYPVLNDNNFYLVSMANFYMQKNHYANTIFYFKQALKLYSIKQIYYDLGEVYEQSGNYQAARKQYLYVMYSQPNLIKPYYLLALSHLKEKNITQFCIEAGSVVCTG